MTHTYTVWRRCFSLLLVGLCTLALGVSAHAVLSAALEDEVTAPSQPFRPQPFGPEPGDPFAFTLPFAPPDFELTVATDADLPEPTAPLHLPDPVWRIGVLTDGLYALDYATLMAAGVPVADVAPERWQLLWRGEPVALAEYGTGDGSFDPGDSLVFFGEKYHASPQDEKYTDENVYWLMALTDTVGLRMPTRDVPPATGLPAAVCTGTAHVEENLYHWARWSTSPGTPTTWFWKKFPTAPGQSDVFTLTLSKPITAANAQLLVEVAAGSTQSHQLTVTVNSTELGLWGWSGKVGYIFTVPVPGGVLTGEHNTISLESPTDLPQTLYLDRFVLSYQRPLHAEQGRLDCLVAPAGSQAFTVTGLSATAHIYDVTDPLQPVALQNAQWEEDTWLFADTPTAEARYVAGDPQPVTPTLYHPPQDLIAPDTGADEIIVAPRHFLAALDPLVAHREAEGLRVRTVAIEDVYAIFGGGVAHPEALRSMAVHAYEQWPGERPLYLFLVGDGHFNFKGYNPESYGEYIPVWIPPYLDFIDIDQGEVPVDAYFGDVTGDGFPELAVGRLPAMTVEEVSGYVTKVLSYETSSRASWMWQSLWMADNGVRSDEGFDLLLNRLIADHVPPGVDVERVYMEDDCAPGIGKRCPASTEAVTTTWNQGAALAVYGGHAFINRWAHEPLLYNDEFVMVSQNATALPFVIALDCWDGYWMFPPKYRGVDQVHSNTHSIGEWTTAILTEGGAIAHLGPAGLAYPAQEEAMISALLHELFLVGERRVGKLVAAARESRHILALARTYTLFGDPAVRLQIPELTVGKQVDAPVAVPGQVLTYSFVLNNSYPVPATVLLTDTLPLELNPGGWLTPPGGQPLASGRHITWTGTVAEGQPVTLQYTATITGGATPGTVITNTAFYAAPEGTGQTTAIFSTRLPEPVLTKEVSPLSPRVDGGAITYTLVLSNSSPAPATVLLTDTLPTELEPGGWLLSPGGGEGQLLAAGRALTWTGTVTLGDPVTLRYTATLGSEAEAGTVITNTAYFTSTYGGAGSASVSFTVSPPENSFLYLPLILRAMP